MLKALSHLNSFAWHNTQNLLQWCFNATPWDHFVSKSNATMFHFKNQLRGFCFQSALSAASLVSSFVRLMRQIHTNHESSCFWKHSNCSSPAAMLAVQQQVNPSNLFTTWHVALCCLSHLLCSLVYNYYIIKHGFMREMQTEKHFTRLTGNYLFLCTNIRSDFNNI